MYSIELVDNLGLFLSFKARVKFIHYFRRRNYWYSIKVYKKKTVLKLQYVL